jgi:hypothetical protein
LANPQHFLLRSGVISSLCALSLLAGCGTPGAPQPPSLRLPKPVDDLQAVRKGDKVYLRWTQPSETSDRQSIKGETTARICRGYRTQPKTSCTNVVAAIKSTTKPGETVSQVDDLSTILRSQAPQDYVIYNVEIVNDRGKSAGPSNAVTVFLAPSVPPPANVSAELLSRNAITVQWTPPSGFASEGNRNLSAKYLYRILRNVRDEKSAVSKKPQPPAVLAEVPATPGPRQSYQDTNFEWEKTYDYRVVGVTQVLSREGKLLSEFEGDDSPAAEIVARDIFPPDPPQGLQAVSAGAVENNAAAIDLSWSPSQESDVSGYNVYRSTGGQPAVRVNKDLVKTPTYRDRVPVDQGVSYTYRVTAVDLRGNESKPSEPATETVR